MRSYIRHPSDIPIHYHADARDGGDGDERLHDISHGGLSFYSEKPLREGMPIVVQINYVTPQLEVQGRVAWCHQESDGFIIGVTFTEQVDLFRVRMVEQICHIEHYKSKVQAEEGRILTGEQAAREWIGKFAGNFPQLFNK